IIRTKAIQHRFTLIRLQLTEVAAYLSGFTMNFSYLIYIMLMFICSIIIISDSKWEPFGLDK
ncbi:Hypothetical protein CINCED_3A024434, partial [Cinara cedri]